MASRWKPDGVCFHYDGATQDTTIEQINEWHKARGFVPRGTSKHPHVGYHRVIRRDGSVHVGRTDDVPGTHCLGHNDHLLGVCLTGGLTPDFPTEAQYHAAVRVAKDYMARFGFGPDRLFRHDQLNKTDCPGKFDLHRVITRIKGGATNVRVEAKQYDFPSSVAGEYLGLVIVDLENVGNHASFDVRFPEGKFKAPPLLFISQPNTNTHWGATVGTSDVTARGARVYLTDRGATFRQAHIGLAILARALE